MKSLSILKRFNDLTLEDINCDYHIHTNWTDGNCDYQDIIERALELGMHTVAFTEHVRRDSTYYQEFFHKINALRDDKKINILIGLETKVLNDMGELDVRPEDFNRAELVLASVHKIPKEGNFISPDVFLKEELFELEQKYTLAIIKGGQAHVLAHPGGMSLMTYGEFPAECWEELISTIAKTDMAVEINYRYLPESMSRLLAPFLKKYNPYVSIGSDVHNISDLGMCSNLVKEMM